jgi:hypothetical protein
MGLRWWRDVLILSQPKQYRMTARRVNTGLYRFVRLGNGPITGLKIRCPKGRAGFDSRPRHHSQSPILSLASNAQDLKVSLTNECENLSAHIRQIVRRCYAFTRGLPNTSIETLYLIGEDDT